MEVHLNFYLSRKEPDSNLLGKVRRRKCMQLFTLSRPVGAVEELMSLDLGLGTTDPMYKDIEIYNDEEDHVDFGLRPYHPHV